MLFFFNSTIDRVRSSPNRVAPVLFLFVFICCILPSISNAYPLSLSSLTNLNHNGEIGPFRNRRQIMFDEQLSYDQDIDRQRRVSGFYIVRQGDYLVLIPDSKHHFTKNMRPYIGRRR